MKSSVKYKIRWATIFLFLLLILSLGFSIFYLDKIKTESEKVLQDNYESLEYSHRMQRVLDSIPLNRERFLADFEKALSSQASNITEPGEKEATDSLRFAFEKIRSGDSLSVRTARHMLHVIVDLNMNAIKSKNDKAEKGATDAMSILIAFVSIIFLVGFTFAFNFPSIITNPIRKLNDAIKAISAKDYSHRIRFESKDEFGELANSFNEMAARLEYFESSNLNKLIFEKSRAESVINSLKDASVGIDKNDVVLFANDQALSLLGLTAKDIVGRKTGDIMSRNDLFRFLLEEKGTSPFKVVVEGRENYFTKEIIEVNQEGSKSRVIVLKNITSFKELDVAKTNFIATVSHELKTPLASSDFSLKLLEDERIGALSQEQKELIQSLKGDNQRMLRILSELLNMSQVEAGRIQLVKQTVHPFSILKNAVETVMTVAKDKNIIIEKRLDENLPEIYVDADKTTWVLNNFLTNAIKYSHNDNEIHVTVSQQNGAVRFSVKDFGPGIAKEYQGRLFERYFQVPGSQSKGSGLGLAISKDFIEAQGGKIWVESDIGEGANFCFEIPV
ncbi:MAG TPA: ATP-binding protein [Chitinophagaceae bacterium]|nr:ATP-binding protein [Chitinophagaceae bacterium]